MLAAKLDSAGVSELTPPIAPEVPASAVEDDFTESADHVERGEIVGTVSAEVIESLPHRPDRQRLARSRAPAAVTGSPSPTPDALSTPSPSAPNSTGADSSGRSAARRTSSTP